MGAESGDPDVPQSASGDLNQVAAVVQRTVASGQLPARVVIHDADGDWLIGDGVNDPNADDACGIFHMSHILELDDTLRGLSDLPPGSMASRESSSSSWTIQEWHYPDDPSDSAR